MAAMKGLLAGAAGAAAYNMYKDSDGGLLSSKDLASGLYDAFQRSGKASVGEMSRLQKQVEDLQGALLKSLHDRERGPIIIQGGGSGRGGTSTAAGVLIIVGTAAIYIRFVKGWRLSDLMYVTRASLTNLKASVDEGLATMKEQVARAREELADRLGKVSAKADDMLQRQDVMDESLGRVEASVGQVGDTLVALEHQVQYSNQAITLLCGAVAEVAKRCGINNGRYTRALEGLSRGGAAPSGVTQLLGGNAPLAALPAGGAGAAGFHTYAGDSGLLQGQTGQQHQQQQQQQYSPPQQAQPQYYQQQSQPHLGPNPAIFTLPPTPVLPSGSASGGAGAGAGGAYARFAGDSASGATGNAPAGGGGGGGGASFGEYLKQGRGGSEGGGATAAAPAAGGGSSGMFGFARR